jgi:hypothetical protein
LRMLRARLDAARIGRLTGSMFSQAAHELFEIGQDLENSTSSRMMVTYSHGSGGSFRRTPKSAGSAPNPKRERNCCQCSVITTSSAARKHLEEAVHVLLGGCNDRVRYA